MPREVAELPIDHTRIPVVYSHVLIIGSGSASLSCAVHLKRMGVEDLLIVTDNRNGGTSRNTGSDKQTYYRLGDSSMTPDSPYDMVRSYTQGGSVHGDIAFIEAQNSSRAFYNLISMGVPFPHNTYGGYTGYKTDHDPSTRGISLGPFTSKVMVKQLQAEVARLDIPMLDHRDVVKLLVADTDRVVGALVLDKRDVDSPSLGFSVVLADHVVLGTGGPAAFYAASVYPRVHVGSIGLAMEIGAEAVNLTESQFGLASTKFRWNLSGSYQQVLPRYVSTDMQGNHPVEFLTPYFTDWNELTRAVFLKGYQWPFDAAKVPDNGSSLIDLLVYHETRIRGRRVFLDYRSNMVGDASWGPFGKDKVDGTALQYLEASGAWASAPVERLRLLNPSAIAMYRGNGIDLATELLEIDVCAQHNNGGLYADIWWESTNRRRLYPIGEVNGSHGVSRPGGSALNAGQVGAIRAATRIAGYGNAEALEVGQVLAEIAPTVSGMLGLSRRWIANAEQSRTTPRQSKEQLDAILHAMQQRMSKAGGPIRSAVVAGCSYAEAKEQAAHALTAESAVPKVLLSKALRLRHMLVAQQWYLYAITRYLENGGGSRGSYLVVDASGEPAHTALAEYRIKPEKVDLRNVVQVIATRNDGELLERMDACRPVPSETFWFERVWSDYRSGAYLQPPKP